MLIASFHVRVCDECVYVINHITGEKDVIWFPLASRLWRNTYKRCNRHKSRKCFEVSRTRLLLSTNHILLYRQVLRSGFRQTYVEKCKWLVISSAFNTRVKVKFLITVHWNYMTKIIFYYIIISIEVIIMVVYVNIIYYTSGHFLYAPNIFNMWWKTLQGATLASAKLPVIFSQFEYLNML